MRCLPPWAIELLAVLISVAAALGVTYLAILKVSQQPGEAFNQRLLGPLGSSRTIGIWIDDAAKLTLAGLSLSLVFQARQFSLGIQGQVYLGGLAAGLVAVSGLGTSPLAIPLGLLSAMLVGAAYGYIHGLLKARLGANEIVSSLMLNYIAIDVFTWLIHSYISDSRLGLINSPPFPAAAVYPALVANTRIDLGLIFALIGTVATWFLLYRTRIGFDLRLVGHNPRFAAHAGIDVKRVIAGSMAIAGLLGGALGAVLVQGQAFGELSVGFEATISLEGLLVAIVARDRPLLVPVVALAYSYLRQGAVLMGLNSDVPAEAISIVKGLIILLVASGGLFAWLRPRATADPLAPVIPGDGRLEDPGSV